MSHYTDVRLWMEIAGQHCPPTPQPIPPVEVRRLRKRLIEEEVGELFKGMQNADAVEIADGIADVLVVTYGTAVSYGINADACFSEAMRANWTKFDSEGKAILDAGGKVMKGPFYLPPDFDRVLRRGW